ncbi:lysozyme inhibitor LprI family protein [Pseudomonas sp. NPDC089554]|uniref:lysozyme inhibitor LprI family protein n=1 Tax=Pseudomonas sp. NPDC089554 TaxID=3390653 RepID=UPI003D005C85
MRKSSLAAMLAAFAFSSAQAEDNSSAYSQCMDKASSTVAMGECIKAETKLQDERLNRVYKQLMAKLDAGKQKSLREVQRNWITYRDGNCRFHAQASGGTLASINGGMCVMDMTRERGAELERILSPGQ